MTAVAIDYSGIATAIKSRLDAGLTDFSPVPAVVIDKEFMPVESWIGIQTPQRSATDGQALAIGSRQRQKVTYRLWLWRYGLMLPDAVHARDSLLTRTEVELLRDNTFGGSVDFAWQEGGRMLTADSPDNKGAYYAGAEIILQVECVAKSL